jgi:hypothetical protein
MIGNSRGIAMLISGVKDRDLESRTEGFKAFVQELTAGVSPEEKQELLSAENLLPLLLAFSLETDAQLKQVMGTVIKATGMLEELKVIPGFDRYLGEVDAKPGYDFTESDFTAMSNGIRRMPGMADAIRGMFGNDIFDKISAERG